MREVNFNVYKFEELSDGAKEKAIKIFKNERSDCIFDDLANDCLTEIFKGTVQSHGYLDFKVLWSLNYCQGDGVRFEGELRDSETFKLASRLLDTKQLQLYLELEKIFTIRIEVTGNTTRYYHWNTMDVEVYCDIDSYSKEEFEEEYKDKKYDKYVALLETFCKAIENDVKHISRKLESEGYRYIETHFEDESIIELLTDSEYEFYEDGSIY